MIKASVPTDISLQIFNVQKSLRRDQTRLLFPRHMVLVEVEEEVSGEFGWGVEILFFFIIN